MNMPLWIFQTFGNSELWSVAPLLERPLQLSFELLILPGPVGSHQAFDVLVSFDCDRNELRVADVDRDRNELRVPDFDSDRNGLES